MAHASNTSTLEVKAMSEVTLRYTVQPCLKKPATNQRLTEHIATDPYYFRGKAVPIFPPIQGTSELQKRRLPYCK